MSDDKDDITKIEDLPDIDRSQEDDHFTDLADMAQKLGITDTEEAPTSDDDPEEINEELEANQSQSFYDSENEFDNNDSTSAESTNFYNESEFAQYSADDYTPENAEEEKESNEDLGQDNINNDFEFSDSPITNESNLNNMFNEDEVDNHIDDTTGFLNPNSMDGQETEPADDLSFQDELEEIDQRFDTVSNDSSESNSLEETKELLPEVPLIVKQEKSPLPVPIKESIVEAPKTLNDIQEFSNASSSYGDFQGEANPPFSLIIKNLKFYEDIDSIANILFELKLDPNTDLENIKTSLQRGQLLIPRLSEYVAIIICHKLRQFDIEISMGLTEEISPPRSYKSNDKGYTSKNTIYKNKAFHKEFVNSDAILTTSLPQLNDYKVIQHLGLVSHTLTLKQSDFMNDSKLEEQILSSEDINNKEEIEKLRLQRENSLAAQSDYIRIDQIFTEENSSVNKTDLSLIYKDVINELKSKALKLNANSILGINFQVLPINLEQYIEDGPNYQVMATGNLAWIEKI